MRAVARIDVRWAVDGYLWSADRRQLRWIPGLDRIARDTHDAGVEVQWGFPPGTTPACSFVWSRIVLLRPAVFDLEGWEIRRLWSHELAHCLLGGSHERASLWQCRRYADLLVPIL